MQTSRWLGLYATGRREEIKLASELAKITITIVLALILASSPACAQIVGELSLFLTDAPIRGWLPATGQCVKDADYIELASVMHEGDDWPYGRCDATHFRLPDLRGRIFIFNNDQTPAPSPAGVWMIRAYSDGQ